MVAFFFTFLALSHRFWYVLFRVYLPLVMSVSSKVYKPLQLRVRIFLSSLWYVKMIVILVIWGAFLLVHTVFLGLVAIVLWILLPQRRGSWHTWNCIYFCLVLCFPDCLFALIVLGFCCDLCHLHPTVQWWCHLIY